MFRRLLSMSLSSLFLAAPAFASWKLAPTVSGDYCVDQGIQILQDKFGAEYVVTYKPQSGAYSDQANHVVYAFEVKELCEGTFYLTPGSGFDIEQCTRAHYGTVPQKFVGLTASGQCQQLVPRPETIRSR